MLMRRAVSKAVLPAEHEPDKIICLYVTMCYVGSVNVFQYGGEKNQFVFINKSKFVQMVAYDKYIFSRLPSPANYGEVRHVAAT